MYNGVRNPYSLQIIGETEQIYLLYAITYDVMWWCGHRMHKGIKKALPENKPILLLYRIFINNRPFTWQNYTPAWFPQNIWRDVVFQSNITLFCFVIDRHFSKKKRKKTLFRLLMLSAVVCLSSSSEISWNKMLNGQIGGVIRSHSHNMCLQTR